MRLRRRQSPDHQTDAVCLVAKAIVVRKTGRGASPSRVRIPDLPPLDALLSDWFSIDLYTVFAFLADFGLDKGSNLTASASSIGSHGGIGRRKGLKIPRLRACRFDSGWEHQDSSPCQSQGKRGSRPSALALCQFDDDLPERSRSHPFDCAGIALDVDMRAVEATGHFSETGKGGL